MNDPTLLDTSSRASSLQPKSVSMSAAPNAGVRTTVLPRVELDGEMPRLVSETRERFESTQVLGRGGVGEVLLARDNDIDRPVAVKRLLPELNDPDTVARFVDEIRTLG